jgi:hypothetical protein
MKPIPAKSLGLVLSRAGSLAAASAVGAPPKRKPKMNGLESRYAAMLEEVRIAGGIEWWKFEGMTLKLADDVRYTPDCVVKVAGGGLEFVETKGFMREAARVRLRVAASMFPFPFYLVREKNGAWLVELVRA